MVKRRGRELGTKNEEQKLRDIQVKGVVRKGERYIWKKRDRMPHTRE